MASLQIIVLLISCGWCANAAQDEIIFPSGRTSRGGLAAGAALPANLTDAISRGSEAFSLDLFQVWQHRLRQPYSPTNIETFSFGSNCVGP